MEVKLRHLVLVAMIAALSIVAILRSNAARATSESRAEAVQAELDWTRILYMRAVAYGRFNTYRRCADREISARTQDQLGEDLAAIGKREMALVEAHPEFRISWDSTPVWYGPHGHDAPIEALLATTDWPLLSFSTVEPCDETEYGIGGKPES